MAQYKMTKTVRNRKTNRNLFEFFKDGKQVATRQTDRDYTAATFCKNGDVIPHLKPKSIGNVTYRHQVPEGSAILSPEDITIND